MDILLPKILEEIYEYSFVLDEEGNSYPLHSHINREKGEFLSSVISEDREIHTTLEVGCAYGIASLAICGALADRSSRRHIIIDPYQYKQWNGIGISNLNRAGFDFFKFIELPSEYALPEIAEKEAGHFDLIFIDGWHTFDQTLLDLYYANQLVRVGGVIILDDCRMASVAKALSYFVHYPAYELSAQLENKNFSMREKLLNLTAIAVWSFIGQLVFPKKLSEKLQKYRFSDMVVLRKNSDDQRGWDWYAEF